MKAIFISKRGAMALITSEENEDKIAFSVTWDRQETPEDIAEVEAAIAYIMKDRLDKDFRLESQVHDTRAEQEAAVKAFLVGQN